MSRSRLAPLLRMRGFLRKEMIQVRRDPSSILLALVMPVTLLLLFGYGVSLDPERVPIATFSEDSSATARELLQRFEASPYFEPRACRSMAEAEDLIKEGEVDGIIRIPEDFERSLGGPGSPALQIVLNGVDSNRAGLIKGYMRAAIGNWTKLRAARGERTAAPPAIEVEPRIWFNPASDSRHFLVPGLVVLIMTLIGTLLTALVIAREWERGTMEALLATPLATGELLLGKVLPYFALGILGLLTAVAGAVFLFGVELQGSFLTLLACSSLFLLAALGMGLAISATFRVQFVAAQISVIAGYLPAFFLSGLLFDLDSTPRVIQLVSHVIPARYFVTICQTVFLAGDMASVILPAALALFVAAALFLTIAYRRLKRGME